MPYNNCVIIVSFGNHVEEGRLLQVTAGVRVAPGKRSADDSDVDILLTPL